MCGRLGMSIVEPSVYWHSCSTFGRVWYSVMQLKPPAASVHFLCLCCGWGAGGNTDGLEVSTTHGRILEGLKRFYITCNLTAPASFWSASAREGWTPSNWCSSENTGKSVLYCNREFNVSLMCLFLCLLPIVGFRRSCVQKHYCVSPSRFS